MLSSPTTLPLLITAPLLAMLLWVVCAALGYRALRTLRVPLPAFSSSERGIVCVAVGAGLLQYGPYLLGMAGKLHPRDVLLGFGVIFCLLLPDLFRIARAAGRSALQVLRALRIRPPSRPYQIWLLLLAVFMGIMLLRALTLTAFGSDDDGYHLSAPRRWLTDGSLTYLPTYTNTNASLGFEMLYAIGLATGNYGIKLIHYCAGVFSLLTLVLCARRLGSGHAGAIAISLLLIATPLCNLTVLLGFAYVDFGACWMTLTSVLIWLVWRQQTDLAAGRLLVVMALVTGFAASFKSTALTVAIAWTPVLVWEARRLGMTWNRILPAAMGLGFVAFLPVTPWMYRSWDLTGNPLFPMLSSLIPTRDWPPEMAAVFSKFFHYYSWAPEKHLSETVRKSILAVTAALVLAGGVITLVRVKDHAIRGLLCFSAIIVLLTLTAGMIFRYWLAAEMCVVLSLATLLVRHYRNNQVVVWLPAMLLVAALLVEETRDPDAAFALDLRTASGVSTLDHEYAQTPAWNMWHYIDQHTASDAHVLVGSFYTTFGASNYGCFWLEVRCFTTDSYIQSFIHLSDWSSFVHSVNQAGIRYLIISEKQFLRGRIGFSFTAGDNEYPFCRRLADQYGKKLAQFGSLQFYSFDPIPEAP